MEMRKQHATQTHIQPREPVRLSQFAIHRQDHRRTHRSERGVNVATLLLCLKLGTVALSLTALGMT